MLIVKTALKNFNAAKLVEELQALSFGGEVIRIDWYGFTKLDARRFTPAAARQKVGEADGIADFADPGELRFHTTRDLMPVEDTQLDSILSAHDSIILTAEQIRQDQDENDLTTLIGNVADFDTLIAQWDGLTTNQAKAALRPVLVNLRRVLRIIVRKYRSAQV